VNAPRLHGDFSATMESLRSEFAQGPSVRLALVFGSAAKGTLLV
jgi:hypothetical protein